MDQSAVHRFAYRQQLVDPAGLSDEVRIIRAQDDAGMIRALRMETAEVLPVEGHDGSSMGSPVLQDRLVRISQIGLSVLENRKDVVSQSA